MNVTTFQQQRRFIETPSGRIAYIEHGSGPVALFIHGVPLNGFHWRHVIAGVSGSRRCIAFDLMGLGYTEISSTQDVSFTAQAQMITQFLDALGIEQVDLVGNDSGGAIAQIFAAHNARRLRTLTLTNCDTHDTWPPKAILPWIDAARRSVLVHSFRKMLENPNFARSRAGLGAAYADPSVLTDETLHVYLDPVTSTPERANNMHRYWTSMDCAHTVAIESQLCQLTVPTLIVWALDDMFFPVSCAQWLQRTIPSVKQLIEVPSAKLFFPEDHPDALLEPLRPFWDTHSHPH